MARTPIPKNLIHDPKEVEENAELYDEIADLVPSLNQNTKELIASYWIETLRLTMSLNPDPNQILRLDKNTMIPFETFPASTPIFKKFIKSIAKKVEKTPDGLQMPFNLVLLKDDAGYYIKYRQ